MSKVDAWLQKDNLLIKRDEGGVEEKWARHKKTSLVAPYHHTFSYGQAHHLNHLGTKAAIAAQVRWTLPML